jgi:hypothetical protein
MGVEVCFKYGNNSLELVHSKQYRVYAIFITLQNKSSWMLHLKREKTSTIKFVQINQYLILFDDVVMTSGQYKCYC